MKQYWVAVVLVIVVIIVGGIFIAKNHHNTSNNYTNNTVQPTGSQTMAANAKPSPSPTPATMMHNSTWQGTLEQSNDSAKGNLMLVTTGHTIYLNTSKDYSALVGKAVTVTYSGTLASFSLENIVAQ